MSADQIAEMSPLIREIMTAPADRDYCVTFELVGNSDAWAQVTREEINLAYPYADDPECKLAGLLDKEPCTGIQAFEPGKYLTLSYKTSDPRSVARLVAASFIFLHDPGDYSVDARIIAL